MDERVRAELRDRHEIQLGKRIGGGGFGDVYRAMTASGVPCAIKVSREKIDVSSGWAAKELAGLEQIKGIGGHPNIVTLSDIWSINGYLVTRWELGEMSLEGRLEQCGEKQGIPLDELLVYMRDAADGIDFLNREQGIYHRDIKPENILLFHRRAKLADLGLAKFAGASTRSHTGSGTLGYIPPEGYDDHRLSPTIDVYSLAATYLRLRTGDHPFGDPRNPVKLIQRQMAGQPVLSRLGSYEKKAVARALAVRPEDRPQDGARAWVKTLSKSTVAQVRQAQTPVVSPQANRARLHPVADGVPGAGRAAQNNAGQDAQPTFITMLAILAPLLVLIAVTAVAVWNSPPTNESSSSVPPDYTTIPVLPPNGTVPGASGYFGPSESNIGWGEWPPDSAPSTEPDEDVKEADSLSARLSFPIEDLSDRPSKQFDTLENWMTLKTNMTKTEVEAVLGKPSSVERWDDGEYWHFRHPNASRDGFVRFEKMQRGPMRMKYWYAPKFPEHDSLMIPKPELDLKLD
jgi:serine/threonine protein kinase